MSIATALTALQSDITAARAAITAKGGTVTSGGGSSQLATDIGTIQELPYALIYVEYPAGSTVSVSPAAGVDGSKTIDSTHKLFYINQNGNYTVTVGASSVSVTITAEGQAPSVVIPSPKYIMSNGGVLSGYNYVVASAKWHTNPTTYSGISPTVTSSTVTINSSTYNCLDMRTSGQGRQGSVYFAVSGCSYLSTINLFHKSTRYNGNTPCIFFASSALPVDGVWEATNIIAFNSLANTSGTVSLDISLDNNDLIYIGFIMSSLVVSTTTYRGVMDAVSLSVE